MNPVLDVVVVGGGPAGATAATDLARSGRSVLLLDRAGRVKPCGGAVPPRLMDEFEIPASLLVNRVDTARIVSPRGLRVDIPVGDGYVGMVDRDVFDEWLRARAEQAGARRAVGTFLHLDRDGDGVHVCYAAGRSRSGAPVRVRARMVIGADGALSAVARQEIRRARRSSCVYAYHEIIRSPSADLEFGPARCDVHYGDALSPDFYAWIFPHGPTTSVGTGSLRQGFPLRQAVARLRKATGLAEAETLRTEGAPIPLAPLSRWDNGRDVVLAGDAAGVVAPASGEGIYYAMAGGRLAAEAVGEALGRADGRALAQARRRFFRLHGQVFFVLRLMQRFWYRTDQRRERFVRICADPDVQRLTFEGYMHKQLVRADPFAHLRIFTKNLAHLTGLVPS